MLTEEKAIAKLRELCEAEDETIPLSDSELTRLLEDYRIASLHTVSTSFDFGDYMVPAITNGRMYECVQTGTTAPTAPVWTGYGARKGNRISDGTVVWRDAGSSHSELWDITGAARAGWQRKARKAASMIDISDKDTKISLGDLHKQCLSMAETFVESFVP